MQKKGQICSGGLETLPQKVKEPKYIGYLLKVKDVKRCQLRGTIIQEGVNHEQGFQEMQYPNLRTGCLGGHLQEFLTIKRSKVLWNFNMASHGYLKRMQETNQDCQESRGKQDNKQHITQPLKISPSCKNSCHCSVSIYFVIIMITSQGSKECAGCSQH